MALEKWSEEDFAKMKVVERAVIATLLPLVQNIDPLLALYALIRCARVMLRKGDEDAQRKILPVICSYLEGRIRPPGESMLWTPPMSRN